MPVPLETFGSNFFNVFLPIQVGINLYTKIFGFLNNLLSRFLALKIHLLFASAKWKFVARLRSNKDYTSKIDFLALSFYNNYITRQSFTWFKFLSF